MPQEQRQTNIIYLVFIALIGWLVPGGGYYLLNERKKALIIFFTITITLMLGLYIGSVNVINPANSNLWFLAQVLNSPAVLLILHINPQATALPVYAKPNEIGQIYTSITGMLNLLCIINSVHLAYKRMQNIPEEMHQ